MKITDIEVLILEGAEDYGISESDSESHGPNRTCVLVVSTDEGVSGIAQMESQPDVIAAVVRAPGEASGSFSGLRALALGENPLEVDVLWDKLFKGSYYYGRRGAALQAISGIDIACWDIMGKWTGLPVATLLGGKRRDRVRAYASTLFRHSPEAMRDASRAYRAQGFTAVKFGWGPFGEDPEQDVALVAAAREGLGDSCELMVDAGWRPRRRYKEALAMVRSLEPYRPYWVEEPCFPEDYATFRRLSDAASTRIAAGEAEATIWGFYQLAEVGGVDVLQPDLSRCGGFTIARRISYLADYLNIQVCPHAWGTGILTAATLQFAVTLPGETFLEFNTSDDSISRLPLKDPLTMEDGYVALPPRSGIGVEFRPEDLRSSALTVVSPS
jgi:L-rhamnonate dehydratase